MKRIHIIMIILSILLISGVALAINANISSFYGQTNPYNVSFVTKINDTYYIQVPRYAYVKNITVTLVGLET